MRKAALLIALAFALDAAAAVQYDFRQVTRTDGGQARTDSVVGRGLIDGNRSRVDFLSGSVFGNGNYVISAEGGKRFMIVNAKDKTYAELDVSSLATALGSSPIKVENLKTDMTKLGDRPIIAGLPTEHYRLTASYEMTVDFCELSIRQKVQTVVDKWTTTAFGDIAQAFFVAGLPRTGNPELDQIIDAETSRFTGFPLRQVVTVITTAEQVKTGRTNLPVQPTRKQTSEMVVTAIQAKDVAEAQFLIPTGFKRVDRPAVLEDAVAKTLTMTPDSR
jgi:hypothetical protein